MKYAVQGGAADAEVGGDGGDGHRTEQLQVIGPPGTRARLPELTEVLFPGSTAVRRRFDVRVRALAPGGSVHAGGVTVEAYRAAATKAGVRLDFVRLADRVVGYSGDTAWTDALVDVAQDADLFGCEAYTVTRRPTISTWRACGRTSADCAAAGCCSPMPRRTCWTIARTSACRWPRTAP